MATITLSAKGHVIIPKDIRERHGWRAGASFEVVEQGDDLVLRPLRAFPATSVDDLLGCLPYEGPAKTLEEMDAGIAKAGLR